MIRLFFFRACSSCRNNTRRSICSHRTIKREQLNGLYTLNTVALKRQLFTLNSCFTSRQSAREGLRWNVNNKKDESAMAGAKRTKMIQELPVMLWARRSFKITRKAVMKALMEIKFSRDVQRVASSRFIEELWAWLWDEIKLILKSQWMNIHSKSWLKWIKSGRDAHRKIAAKLKIRDKKLQLHEQIICDQFRLLHKAPSRHKNFYSHSKTRAKQSHKSPDWLARVPRKSS